MNAPFRWTLELCQADAAKYATRSAWSKGNQAGYAAAKRNGWFEQCVAHMGGNKQWTKEEVLETALRHNTRNAFKTKDVSAYRAATYNGWLEEACAHMVAVREEWTLEKCKAVSAQYSVQNQWKHGDRNSYFAAYRNGWVEECCAHMDEFEQIDFETCFSAAQLYTSRSEWKYRDPRTYRAAGRNGWSDVCTKHMDVLAGPSVQEMQVFDYVKSICPDAVQGVRNLLGNRQEIDIYVPSLKLGIEFNGLFWHSEKYDVAVDYHQRKTDAAMAQGIRLVHIWSDEWSEKQSVVKGYLRQLLGAPYRKINARDCDLLPTTGADSREFLDTNHIQGFKGGTGFSLIHEGEVVAVAIVAKNTFGETELARWCVKMDVRIVGGFQRVLSKLPTGLVSFCDTAKHSGSGYLKAGWVQIGRAQPTVWLTDGKIRRSRLHFKKQHMLRLGAVGETEKEMAESLGFYRIGGCEQLKFEWLPKELRPVSA
jgi:hypothetical protein